MGPFCSFSFCLLLMVVFCKIDERLCDSTIHDQNLQESPSPNVLGRMLRQQLNTLLAQQQSPPSAELSAKRIGTLRDYARRLDEVIQGSPIRKLMDPLIRAHATKIVQFCDNVIIGGENVVSREVIEKRWQMLTDQQSFIDQLKARVNQVQRLIDTNSVEWEIWPFLLKFAHYAGPQGRVTDFAKNLRQKIDYLKRQLENSNSFYGQKPFEEAMGHLDKLTKDDDAQDGAAKLATIFQIVPNLIVGAIREMLRNLAVNTLRGEGAVFFGTNFLKHFAAIANGVEVECGAVLRRSPTVVPNAHPLMVSMVQNLFDEMKNEANLEFGKGKVAIIQHIYRVGNWLKNEMAQLRKELSNSLQIHTFKRHKRPDGAIKRNKPIEILKYAQNVLVIVHTALGMVDMQQPSELAKEKFVKLEQLMARHQLNAVNEEEYEVLEKIADCLGTDQIEKGIEREINALAYLTPF